MTSPEHRSSRPRLRRAGGFLLLGAGALALATLNTGNNLLYLLLGALLGTVLLSRLLARSALRSVTVARTVPRALVAGASARIEYALMTRSRLPLFGLTVQERSGHTRLEFDSAFLPVLSAAQPARTGTRIEVPRRGVYELDDVALATSYPFGLFTHERRVRLPGALVVWPRTDRPVPRHALAGERAALTHAGAGVMRGRHRGEYRSLREYRPGDDPADLHWRSTARRGAPVVREYERDAAEEYWIVLDRVSPTAAAGEAAVEAAAALVVSAARRGDRFGLAAGAHRVEPGPPLGRVEAALDVLAAARLYRHGPAPEPPASPLRCVLVTARGGVGWGDVVTVTEYAP